MTSGGQGASTLEDTHPGFAIAASGELGPNYFWPVWRFGRVLQPVGAESLAVEVAQEIGSLFEPGKPAAVRYTTVRTEELRQDATRAGGCYLRAWPEHLRYGTDPFVELERKWFPEEILITYSFVPIIRLPQFVFEIDGGSWQVRESLTVCGSPAKSKVWVTASLISLHGEPTDAAPLSKDELNDARRAFEPFARTSLASLTAYYLAVLNEDTAALALKEPLHVHELRAVAETEIVSLASGVHLSAALDEMEDKGFKKFCLEAPQGLFPGSREVLDFLQWTDSVEIQGDGEWRPGRPKILALYAEEPACGSVRALVIPRINADENRTWYAALTERRRPEKQPSCVPLSEAAGRSLAKEYGRYF